MKIIYCHHAQRDHDKSRPKELWQEDGITNLGIKDANIYAKMLKKSGIKLSAIYNSPFKRCLLTAEIINKDQNVPLIFENRFNEYKSYKDETWTNCQQRIIDAIKDIVNNYSDNDIVLCVTSGVNLGAFICLAYGIKPSEETPFLGVSSCSPIIFEYKKEQ